MADSVPLATCYGSGSIAGAIIGTLLITLAIVGAGLLLYNIYWRSRKGKHLVLVTDVENAGDHYAFDNPNFRESTPIKQAPSDHSGKLNLNWLSGWSPLHVFSPRSDKQRSLDDSFITDSQFKMVSLKSHDFTGLGFTVCGNMRDGIFVKDLLHRGPAFESGCINPGDRIDSVCISFRHMVFEDALTILSYASPYEVQVQVEHNATSRPSTLLRKRDTSASNTVERIRHPFYRSQSIADLTMIGKSSGMRSHQKSTPIVDKNQSHKILECNLTSSDSTTIKLSNNSPDIRSDSQSGERRGLDMVDKTEPPKHAKYGIRVFPVSIKPRGKDHSDNEQNVAIEEELLTSHGKWKGADEIKDVKSLLTKGLQNIKEKINQNTLGQKRQDEMHECVSSEKSASENQLGSCNYIPEEVARAGVVARNNRKSLSAEILSARQSEPDLPGASAFDSDTASEGSHPHVKKTKGKAPPPPRHKVSSDKSLGDGATVAGTSVAHDIFEPPQGDSDSEVEGMGLTCTQATVHHSSVTEEPESNRKAASLGDLSRLDDPTGTGPLERAVSLDLDAPHGKKRKAPPPPSEEFVGVLEEGDYRKEPRLEGYNTFQRRLKKSSDFGTLEDALQDPDSEDCTTLNKKPRTPEPITDLGSIASKNIQKFSTWLEKVRKPNDSGDYHITLDVNGTSDSEMIKDEKNIQQSNTKALNHSTDVDFIYSSPLNSDADCSSTAAKSSSVELGNFIKNDTEDAANSSTHDLTVLTNNKITSDAQHSESSTVTEESEQKQAPFSFSVNGLNLQEQSGTILLIPQSTEQNYTQEEEIPPQLPSSPPPSTSLTYITEIRVTTPEPVSQPINVKPARKDVNPEISRIPVRTMKSETGQKVLAAIQSLAAKETGKVGTKEETTPSVAGFYLKKVSPPILPLRNPRDSHQSWSEETAKDRVNGTPMHLQIQTGVSLPVKTSATKIVFETQEDNEEF